MRYWILLTVVLILTCCVEQGLPVMSGPPEKIMSESENFSSVVLSGKARIENNKLIVEYSVRNTTPTSLYIFDEMIEYDSKGQPKINKTTAYCFWEEPNTLRLARALLRIPLEKDIYSLEIPYARELKPQATLSGKIELDIPVKEKSPFYAPPTEENSKIVDCTKVRLFIGWTEFREGTQITEANIGGEKVLRIRGNWQPHVVQEEFGVPVKVVAYTDIFDRQLPQS